MTDLREQAALRDQCTAFLTGHGPVRPADLLASIPADTVLQAIETAINNKTALGIDVINLSLGHPIYEPADRDPLVRAVESAVRAGIVVVTAAGNYGYNHVTWQSGYAGVTSPGNAPSAITVGSLRTLNTAEVSFQGKHNAYTCTLADMGPAGDNYIDANLAGAVGAGTAKSGYFFVPLGCGAAIAIPPAIGPVTTPVVSYQWASSPANLGVTGNQAFCTDTSAVIWKDVNGVGAACLAANPRVPIG